MLRGEGDITRAGLNKEVGPMVGIEELGVKHGREVEVLEIGAIGALMERPGSAPSSCGVLAFMPLVRECQYHSA